MGCAIVSNCMNTPEDLGERITANKERYHRIAAYVVFIRTNLHGEDEVLLCKVRNHDIWALPGGGLEEGEYPLDTAKREAHEELGREIVEISDPRLLKQIPEGVNFFHIVTRHMPHFPDLLRGEQYPRTQKSHVFGARVHYTFNPEPTKEMECFRWVTLAELDTLYHGQQELGLSMRHEIHEMAHYAIEGLSPSNHRRDIDMPFVGVRPDFKLSTMPEGL